MSCSSYDDLPVSPTLGFAVAASPHVLHAFGYRTWRWSWGRLTLRRWAGGASHGFCFFLYISLPSLPTYIAENSADPPQPPPSDSPRSSHEPLAAFPLLPYHSDCHTTIHATRFCFNFPSLCITKKTHKSTLPSASRFSGELPICWGGGKGQGHNIVCMFQSSKVTTDVKTGKRLRDLLRPGWRNPSQKQDKVTRQPAMSWLTTTSSTDLNNQQFLPNIVFGGKIGNIQEFQFKNGT